MAALDSSTLNKAWIRDKISIFLTSWLCLTLILGFGFLLRDYYKEKTEVLKPLPKYSPFEAPPQPLTICDLNSQETTNLKTTLKKKPPEEPHLAALLDSVFRKLDALDAIGRNSLRQSNSNWSLRKICALNRLFNDIDYLKSLNNFFKTNTQMSKEQCADLKNRVTPPMGNITPEAVYKATFLANNRIKEEVYEELFDRCFPFDQLYKILFTSDKLNHDVISTDLRFGIHRFLEFLPFLGTPEFEITEAEEAKLQDLKVIYEEWLISAHFENQEFEALEFLQLLNSLFPDKYADYTDKTYVQIFQTNYYHLFLAKLAENFLSETDISDDFENFKNNRIKFGADSLAEPFKSAPNLDELEQYFSKSFWDKLENSADLENDTFIKALCSSAESLPDLEDTGGVSAIDKQLQKALKEVLERETVRLPENLKDLDKDETEEFMANYRGKLAIKEKKYSDLNIDTDYPTKLYDFIFEELKGKVKKIFDQRVDFDQVEKILEEIKEPVKLSNRLHWLKYLEKDQKDLMTTIRDDLPATLMKNTLTKYGIASIETKDLIPKLEGLFANNAIADVDSLLNDAIAAFMVDLAIERKGFIPLKDLSTLLSLFLLRSIADLKKYFSTVNLSLLNLGFSLDETKPVNGEAFMENLVSFFNQTPLSELEKVKFEDSLKILKSIVKLFNYMNPALPISEESIIERLTLMGSVRNLIAGVCKTNAKFDICSLQSSFEISSFIEICTASMGQLGPEFFEQLLVILEEEPEGFYPEFFVSIENLLKVIVSIKENFELDIVHKNIDSILANLSTSTFTQLYNLTPTSHELLLESFLEFLEKLKTVEEEWAEDLFKRIDQSEIQKLLDILVHNLEIPEFVDHLSAISESALQFLAQLHKLDPDTLSDEEIVALTFGENFVNTLKKLAGLESKEPLEACKQYAIYKTAERKLLAEEYKLPAETAELDAFEMDFVNSEPTAISDALGAYAQSLISIAPKKDDK
jgi:hypothetical protein